jgi:hypothetical protein
MRSSSHFDTVGEESKQRNSKSEGLEAGPVWGETKSRGIKQMPDLGLRAGIWMLL